MEKADWFTLNDPSEMVSPSLLIYPERVEKNLEQMISSVGDPARLRPHIKTHKMEAIVRLKLQLGITKFKCATIAEAEMLGRCDAPDVLLAMQPVGAQLIRLVKLIKKFPNTQFSTLVDNRATLDALGEHANEAGLVIQVWLDINSGMNRTGIKPGDEALNLYEALHKNPFLETRGLHLYDGHVRNPNLEERRKNCEVGYQALVQLKRRIEDSNIPVPDIVLGGSPTFPLHAARFGVECSPGTTVLWDTRSKTDLKDMSYLPAAVLFSRVLSHPSEDSICIDLGHKAVAPEMPFPRVEFLNVADLGQLSHSEEHLVVKVKDASKYPIGRVCYAIPVHICPTVAKYPWALTVKNGEVNGKWYVTARDHVLSF